jgi:probable HAF family extracellular repeat protein
MMNRISNVNFGGLVGAVAWRALLCVGLGSSIPCQAQPKYILTDLGTLGGLTSSVGSINRAGQVVGDSDPGVGGFSKAFRTAPNAAINPATDNLGTLGGGGSAADGINAAGVVVGGAGDAGAVFHAFRTASDAAINPATDNLGLVGEEQSSEAFAINDIGQVVMASYGGAHGTRGFRVSPGQPVNTSTDDLGGYYPCGSFTCVQTIPTAINSPGQVAGYLSNGVSFHAFRTVKNAAINLQNDYLGTLGVAKSFSYGINDTGQVVGSAEIANGNRHAFRTAPDAAINSMTDDLGTFGGTDSGAEGINASGQVVGWALTAAGESHAFLYSGAVMYDLNNLIPAGSGWILEYGAAINDAGQIVGNGFFNGVSRAFRLDQPLYNVCLLYDSTKTFKAGSTIPIKLQLCDSNGKDLSSSSLVAHALSITQISTSTSEQVQASGNANPDGDFRFDPTLGPTGGYIFNLSTKGLTTGTYSLNFKAGGDPATYIAPFQLK